MFRKPISISFAPNFQKDDVWLAIRLLFGLVSRDTIRHAPGSLVSHIEKIFPSQKAFLFSSGRAALEYSLRALGLAEGDEVLVQAFTCVAVPNAVVWADLQPVFVDCDGAYNFEMEDLARKISPKTKAIVVQHTFGIPAPMDKIRALAQKHGLFVVEDCAHALGGTYKGKKLGEWGDVAILSFGRDKVVSSVFGGVALTNNPVIKKSLKHQEKNLVKASWFFTVQQLLYLIIYAASLPLYSVLIGKIILRVSRMCGLLSPAVYKTERTGGMPQFIHSAFPEKLCVLANHQLAKLDRFTQYREKLSDFYNEKLGLNLEKRPYLRIPFVVRNKKTFLARAKQEGFHLGNWYRGPIDPPNADLAQLGYTPCPQAEELALHTINLPTHINTSLRDATKIVNFVQKHHNDE